MMQKKIFLYFIYFGTFTAFALLLYALWAQHIAGFEPCVRCIYQRFFLLGIGLGGILALCHPYLRPVGLMLVFFLSIMGLLEAQTHVGVIAGTVQDFCPFRPNFGFLGRLDLIAPWFFEATGDCADDSWKLLGFNMPQWMWFIFLNYALGSFFLSCYGVMTFLKNRKNRF